MIDKIKNLLESKEKISAWTLTETKSKSTELFLIKDKLDINRATKIHEFSLRVFVDFEENNEKFKGDAKVEISPDDDKDILDNKIEQAIFSASFVKNKWYDLPDAEDGEYLTIKKHNNISDLSDKYDEVFETIFKDYGFESKLNSAELFAIESEKRVITSKGVDVVYPNSVFTFEIVTDNNEHDEKVEIFKDYTLTNIDLEELEKIIRLQLEETDGRAIAKRHDKIDSIRLVLSGEAVEEFLQFYLYQATDSMIYMNMSRVELGKKFIKENSNQSLNFMLNPALESSVFSRPVDDEGKKLSKYPLFEDGLAVNLRTGSRFSHYMNVENKGFVETFEVDGGNKELSDYLNSDYIEILAFSSFLMDPTTGDFGGEFRLAKLVKDGETKYITGGAISENIFDQQDKMYFSKELEIRKNSLAPKAIIFDNIHISGD